MMQEGLRMCGQVYSGIYGLNFSHFWCTKIESQYEGAESNIVRFFQRLVIQHRSIIKQDDSDQVLINCLLLSLAGGGSRILKWAQFVFRFGVVIFATCTVWSLLCHCFFGGVGGGAVGLVCFITIRNTKPWNCFHISKLWQNLCFYGADCNDKETGNRMRCESL